MSSLLEPVVLERLKRLRFTPRLARASRGVGDTRSRSYGAGIEFADFREYQAGDDIRFVDRHVFARHQRAVVRRYVLDQQVQVHVLLDLSASMDRVDTSKGRRARVLAGAAVAIGLFGGERVRIGCFAQDALTWFPSMQSPARLGAGLAWLASRPSGGEANLESIATQSMKLVGAQDLLVVISDWMVDGAAEALQRWAAADVEVFAVQVLSPAELDPRRLDAGRIELQDAETGATLEVTLDAGSIAAYEEALSTWRTELARTVTGAGGRWSSASAVESLEAVLFRDWRRDGLVT